MNMRELMRSYMPENRKDHPSSQFNIVGDIAILSIPTEICEYKKDIAEAIISEHKYIKTVLNKASKVKGDKRIASFEILAGNDTVTIHREFGFLYKLDVTEVFFNGRLGYERNRVALKTKPGERVFIPFCGIGPFVVPLLARGTNVVGLEKNRNACLWLAENLKLNNVTENATIINGDAFSAVKMMKQLFDRIVIPTPYGMDKILDSIGTLVKKGGMIHFYTFKKRYQIETLIERYENMGYIVESHRRCGNVAPGVSRWVFDLIKSKT